MKTITTLVLGLCFAFSALAATGSLDGKTFSGKITQAGEKKGEKDKLVFKDGKLTSTECVQYGFKDGEYTATTEGDTTTFKAEINGEKGAMMTWTGTIKGDKLTAQAVRTQGTEKPSTSTFAGTLAATPTAKKAKK